MNTQLVDTLVQIIHSLSQEERALLDEKLKKPDWRETLQRIKKLQADISAHRGDKPLEPSVDEIIHQMRGERDEQLMRAGFPESFETEPASDI